MPETMLDRDHYSGRYRRIGLDRFPGSVVDTFTRDGLGWGVETAPAFTETPDGFRPVPGRLVTRRTDTLEPLGVVSPQYRTVGNVDLAEHLDRALSRISENGGPRIGGAVAAGAWGNGRRIWCRLDFGNGDVSGDPIARHAIVTASHDGSGAVRVVPTTVRLFCTNQVPGLLRNGGGARFGHRGDMARHLDATARFLADAAGHTAGMIDRMRMLAQSPVGTGWSADYFGRVVADTLPTRDRLALAAGDPGPFVSAEYRNRWESLRDRVRSAVADMAARYDRIGDPADSAAVPISTRGTRYHALQAATESLEWSARVRSDESRDTGRNGTAKATALALAVN
jgi:hypothetical protein